MTEEKNTARNRILKAGAKIMHRKGFNATGLQEVLDAAEVPKGSFYHYFKSKEDFCLHLIDYMAERLKRARAAGRVPGQSRLDQLRSSLRSQVEAFHAADFQGGCLIGNLAQEMGDQNPNIRKKLDRVFEDMKLEMADQLEQAREQGEVSGALDPVETAEFIISAWEGALMRMKVCRSMAPQDIFEHMVFDRLLDRK